MKFSSLPTAGIIKNDRLPLLLKCSFKVQYSDVVIIAMSTHGIRAGTVIAARCA